MQVTPCRCCYILVYIINRRNPITIAYLHNTTRSSRRGFSCLLGLYGFGGVDSSFSGDLSRSPSRRGDVGGDEIASTRLFFRN